MEYTDSIKARGISESHRRLLARLHRCFTGPFTVRDAAGEWETDHGRTARLLAYWASRGWLSRVRRGTYITVPLEARSPSERKEDPWVIAAALFTPAYIGGWSACEHWGLTDQIFSDVVVFTSHRVRRRRQTIQGITFVFKSIPPKKVFGLSTIWRGQTKIQISDPSRTIADVLDNPSLGGGIKHVAEVLHEYFAGEHRNDRLLTDYVGRLDNRTVRKRLGYLIETLAIDAPEIIKFCKRNLSTGYSKLDPTIRAKGRLTRRWNLGINVRIK